MDAPDPLMQRAGAAVARRVRRSGEALAQRWEALQEVVEAEFLSAPEHGDADELRSDRRHVSLAARPPIDLDEIAPGRQGVVAPHAEAAAFFGKTAGTLLQIRPAADLREQAVGSGDPAGADQPLIGLDPLVASTGARREPLRLHAPEEADAGLLGSPDERLMESEAPHPQPSRSGKGSLGEHLAIQIADAAEGEGVARAE